MGTILIVGASRGLGCAMAEEFVGRGWDVLGTVRGGGTALHALAERHPGRVGIEVLDVREEAQVEALGGRLAGRAFDVLFVNAGTTNPQPMQTIGEVSTQDFVDLMVTNALSPMRVLERLERLVPAGGLLGVMSSGQGSISNNETGLREAYRGSKAALNMFLRSFAARQAGSGRAIVAMAPGWVKTELGGEGARLEIGESVPGVVDVLLGALGTEGARYVDYLGRTVPW